MSDSFIGRSWHDNEVVEPGNHGIVFDDIVGGRARVHLVDDIFKFILGTISE